MFAPGTRIRTVQCLRCEALRNGALLPFLYPPTIPKCSFSTTFANHARNRNAEQVHTNHARGVTRDKRRRGGARVQESDNDEDHVSHDLRTQSKGMSRIPAGGSSRGGYIPFEGLQGSTAGILDGFKGRTVTAKERKAFESLMRKTTLQQAAVTEDTQSLDGREDELGKTLEAAFEASLQDSRWRKKSTDGHVNLRKNGKGLPEKGVEEHEQARESSQAGISSSDFDRVLPLYLTARHRIDAARTDVELWQHLESTIFDPVKRLNLDKPSSESAELSNKAQRRQSVETESDEILRAWSAVLSILLRAAMLQLDKLFPGSMLPLLVLPKLKKIGPASFTLGATTGLYNLHLNLQRKKAADIHGFLDTLAEMDQAVYQLDSGTYSAIQGMLSYADKAQTGLYGPGVKAIWSSDRKQRAVSELRQWQQLVRERQTEDALRKAFQNESKEAYGTADRERTVPLPR